MYSVLLYQQNCHRGTKTRNTVLNVNDIAVDEISLRRSVDYGQVKSLDEHERVRVAKLILSIADGEPDDVVAGHFRDLGMKTRADSTRFIAEFGRLMFGPFEAKHLDHEWHRELHREDRVLYFPNELSMVYRTALLLRGLAMSLQFNPSVGEEWRHHAQEAIKLHGAKT